ncbi:hypothetical protein OG439_03365 [Amycolatopsis sp. NBC_01307]|uniref:hypothetical protein n=1 Tax=Amycolatopsis sp. NBC_01307 TaxID=2903561 RepID=UPI002E115A8F|nr:hypothetical protein OG439_03365 [Amycolatopsis sp. NBC_01307]
MTDLNGWWELPQAVRDVVEHHLGPVGEVVPAETLSSSLAMTVLCDGRSPVFLKGVRGVSPAMRWLRNEVETAALVSGLAPEVLFHEDIRDSDDWLIAGFAHLGGRPAKLGPGSPDLPAVADALNRIGAIEAPHLQSLAHRWRNCWWRHIAETRPDLLGRCDVDRLAAWEATAPGLLTGNRLLHTDLHGDQFLLGEDGEFRVVDWGWPASGAPWIDPAFMVIRLIEAGHEPAAAEAWAAAHTRWASAAPESITAFAVYVAGLWTGKAAAEPLARVARDYANRRLTLAG